MKATDYEQRGLDRIFTKVIYPPRNKKLKKVKDIVREDVFKTELEYIAKNNQGYEFKDIQKPVENQGAFVYKIIFTKIFNSRQ